MDDYLQNLEKCYPHAFDRLNQLWSRGTLLAILGVR